jgi:hypothetical protein
LGKQQGGSIQFFNLGPPRGDFHKPVAPALFQGAYDPGGRLEQVGKAARPKASFQEDDPTDLELCQFLDHEPQPVLVVGWSNGDGYGN